MADNIGKSYADLFEEKEEDKKIEPTKPIKIKPNEEYKSYADLFEKEVEEVPVEEREPIKIEPTLFKPKLPIFEDKKQTVVEGLKLGLKRSLDPFKLTSFAPTKEELEKEKTGLSLAAELGANIASDIIVTGLAGAAVGSMFPVVGNIVGGTLGAVIKAATRTKDIAKIGTTVGLAVYRGFGNEITMAEEMGRKATLTNGFLGTLVEVNPLVKYSSAISKGAKISKALTQGTLQGLHGYTTTNSALVGTLSGALGVGIGAISPDKLAPIKLGFKQKMTSPIPSNKTGVSSIILTEAFDSNLRDESFQGALELISKRKGKSFFEMPTKYTEAIRSNKYISDDIDFVEFSQWMINKQGSYPGKPFQKEFFKNANQWTDNELVNQFKHFKQQKLVPETMDYIEEINPDFLTTTKDPMGWFKTHIADAFGNAEAVDREAKTNFTGWIMSTKELIDKSKNITHPLKKRVLDLGKLTKKNNISPERIGQALEKKVTDLAPIEEKIVKEARKIYNEAAETLKAYGVNIQNIDDYMTHSTKDIAMVASQLKKRYTDIDNELFNIKKFRYDDLFVALKKNKEVQELSKQIPNLNEFKQSLEYIGVNFNDIKNKADFQNILDQMLDPRSKLSQGFKASAAFKREWKDVPELIKEENVFKQLNKYIDVNFKAALLKDSHQQMNLNLSILRGLNQINRDKFNSSYKYFNKLSSYMSGTREGLVASMESQSNKIKNYCYDIMLDGSSSEFKKQMAQYGAAIPDFLGWMASQAYPNLLGWSLYAPIRNMSQPWLLTAPRILESVKGAGRDVKNPLKAMPGMTKYAYGVTTKATAKAARARIKGEKIGEFLRKNNYIAEQRLEMEEAVREGLKELPVIGKTVKFIDSMGQWGMKLYTKADECNRYITHYVGQELAEDFVKGHKHAVTFIDSLPVGVKGQVIRLKNAGKTEEMNKLISSYLVSKTQFIYDKVSMNQLGRSLGIIGSMFTKWPATILGDIKNLHDQRKYIQLTAKYIAPMLALSGVDSMIRDMDLIDNPIGRTAYPRGVFSYSPILSVEISTPPLFNLGASLVGSLSDTAQFEFAKAGEKLGKAGMTFLPLLGQYRKISKAIVEPIIEETLPGVPKTKK